MPSGVCAEFGITEADIETENNNLYGKTPIRVTYQGIPMYIFLVVSHDRLEAFQYVAIYENDTQKAAEDTLKLMNHIWDCQGKGENQTTNAAGKDFPDYTLKEISIWTFGCLPDSRKRELKMEISS